MLKTEKYRYQQGEFKFISYKLIKVNARFGLACEHGGPETRPRRGGTGG